MNSQKNGNKNVEKFKYIDQECNNYDEEDSDSLASALSDYNSVFYDAPTITVETKIIKEGSTDISFEERTDEDLSSLESEEIVNFKTKMNKLEKEKTVIKDNINDEFVTDDDIEKEFEEYLNNDENDEIDDDIYRRKRSKIKKLENKELSFENYEQLRQMAIDKYGFLNKKFRRKAWPILILYKKRNKGSIDDLFNSSMTKFKNMTDDQVKNNKYFNQITLDVVRTLKRFPPEISDKLRLKLQNQLIDLICRILIKHDNLHYYQGYHDICLTFLLVVGAEECLPLLENITLTHLTCFMETTMESTLKLLFNIMPLIDKINSKVAEHIQKAELGVIFGLSWLITWYSHVMNNLKIILRLYDFFIATDPMMPIYLGAIIVSDNAEDILNIDCDMASLHTVISKYPTHLNDIEQIEDYILSTLKLFESYPPKSLGELNQKWIEKCKRIQEEEEMRIKIEMEENLRQRRKKNKNSNNNNGNENNKVSKRKNFSLMRLKDSNGKLKTNRFMLGLTFTVGVAAVAMYAMNTNVVKDTPDIFSKFYQLLSLKEF